MPMLKTKKLKLMVQTGFSFTQCADSPLKIPTYNQASIL